MTNVGVAKATALIAFLRKIQRLLAIITVFSGSADSYPRGLSGRLFFFCLLALSQFSDLERNNNYLVIQLITS